MLKLVFQALVVLALTARTVMADQPDDARPVVHVVSNDFVLAGKLRALGAVAEEVGVQLRHVLISTPGAQEWWAGADLVVLDVPRPSDRGEVETFLEEHPAPEGVKVPRITIGGGPPAGTGLARPDAMKLAGYYGFGGRDNLRAFFRAVLAWHGGKALTDMAAPARRPAAGVYHPAAERSFADVDTYLDWGQKHGRWPEAKGRVIFVFDQGSIAGLQTQVIDGLISRSEAAGLIPLAVWIDSADERALSRFAEPAQADAIVNMTHMLNGPARSAEFEALDMPAIQTLSYREGNLAEWMEADTGIPARLSAPFLAVPEAWGMSDPIVLSTVENETRQIIPAQADLLIEKLVQLVALRHTPAGEKRLAMMFWNYPAGEKNLSASNLNVPRSIERMTTALGAAGYDVPVLDEAGMIEAGQAMLAGIYRSKPLETLLARDLAVALPVSEFEAWVATLPGDKRHAIGHLGAPGDHWAVRDVDGQPSFVIPRLRLGNMVILPQMPRGAEPGAHLHDMTAPPDPLYMAAYLYLRESFGADALIHLGTHGTQEWLPGKDRGLAASDDPFLMLGGMPVFYPYIQDNVSEALQARRRGRAVTVSHQTPPFGPSGLYDELRDLHEMLHDYMQLEPGAVRQTTGRDIVTAAVAADIDKDLGVSEADLRADLAAHLPALHDLLHELSRQVIPLGLHVFGEPAAPEDRLSTVLQQLGPGFAEAAGDDPDEMLTEDNESLRQSRSFDLLRRHVLEAEPLDGLSDELRVRLERARKLDAGLAAPGEMEALLNGLAGGFVRPGTGGDPVRTPDTASGRNLHGFEPDRLPSRAAFEAGKVAFDSLAAELRNENDGVWPEKIAFSLWASEAIRHQGITEAQVLHALGLRPVWRDDGRVLRLEIVPDDEMDHPRIDVVVQVTSVYRDQFDGFMRLLADGIDRLAARDTSDNIVARNSARISDLLEASGVSAQDARAQASLRIFGNAPGRYGSGLADRTVASDSWNDDGTLAKLYLDGNGYAFGARAWGVNGTDHDLFAEQLSGTQAVVMSRSSNVHGVLSTDHPFDFMGGLSLATRHLDGQAPSMFVTDMRRGPARMQSLSSMLSTELRARYLNPQWIEKMMEEGYAGTLSMLNATNNLFGWQVVDPSSVRADQWQAYFETYVQDSRDLGLDAYFEAENPTAQAQLMERMIEAIGKGYWDAPDETRRALADRWQQLEAEHDVETGAEVTRTYVAEMAAGFGLEVTAPAEGSVEGMQPPETSEAEAAQTQAVSGQALELSEPAEEPRDWWLLLVGAMPFFACFMAGVGMQWHRGSRCRA
ncbi:cobaltochelatase subunit CobN [Roseovarius sp. MMSF_3281]|uniref:cobaltochelatase subunit CobN n=1 Tax=Roseovarius sp. MMSF_3281 TaxID=3046694 RepID=UPI00273E928D|nr:cobaltochelatase subunit CobN [Roseovarius sp. MMSF_3281]